MPALDCHVIVKVTYTTYDCLATKVKTRLLLQATHAYMELRAQTFFHLVEILVMRQESMFRTLLKRRDFRAIFYLQRGCLFEILQDKLQHPNINCAKFSCNLSRQSANARQGQKRDFFWSEPLARFSNKCSCRFLNNYTTRIVHF